MKIKEEIKKIWFNKLKYSILKSIPPFFLDGPVSGFSGGCQQI